MNGTIDLSDGRHGNANTRGHDDDLGYNHLVEELDESCSETASSCGCCSTCSSCSLCDLCELDDFDCCSERDRDGFLLPGSMRTLSFEDQSAVAGRRHDHFTPFNSHKVKPLNSEPLDDESGIYMYSSGSDKETFNTHSGSTSSNATQGASGKYKSQKHAKKRVTFLDFSTETGQLSHSSKSKFDSRSLGNQKTRYASNTNVNTNVELEYNRLESILHHIDPFKLHSIMKRQLRKKKPQTILALGKLLPKERYSGETVHCVRCHKEYSSQFNKKDCYLSHPKSKLTTTCLEGSTAYIKCSVCKKEYWVQKQNDMSGVNIGHCYVGKHTSCPDDIVYTPLGAAQSCEDRGCIEFYV